MSGKVKSVSFRRAVSLANTIREGPEQVIATKGIFCLVASTSIRVAEKLEIEKETF